MYLYCPTKFQRFVMLSADWLFSVRNSLDRPECIYTALLNFRGLSWWVVAIMSNFVRNSLDKTKCIYVALLNIGGLSWWVGAIMSNNVSDIAFMRQLAIMSNIVTLGTCVLVSFLIDPETSRSVLRAFVINTQSFNSFLNSPFWSISDKIIR